MTVTSFATHEVFNQSPPLGDVDLYSSDAAATDSVAAFGAGQSASSLAAFGKKLGASEMAELARLANEYTPKLRSHDRQGRRADVVEFHPAYHRFMEESIKAGVHASVWAGDGSLVPGEHVARSARHYLASQVEQGHLCPVTMTHAATGALIAEPALLQEWLPRIRSREYDPRFLPSAEKKGVTPTASSDTNGFSPRRCATRFWCSRRRRAGSPVFSYRATSPTARRTRCG
jgi:putative acyl-CoA dehydrogenase